MGQQFGQRAIVDSENIYSRPVGGRLVQDISPGETADAIGADTLRSRCLYGRDRRVRLWHGRAEAEQAGTRLQAVGSDAKRQRGCDRIADRNRRSCGNASAMERKGVVSGTRVAGRVDLGGSR